MATTIWLASYPKSGNTWLRIFLASLLHPQRQIRELDDLPLYTPIASSRRHFDDALGIPSALLTPAEIAALRPDAAAALGDARGESWLLRKVHDAYTWLPDGRPLLGRAPRFAAIYLLRDPWDVAVSAANHFSCSLEEAVRRLCDPHAVIGRSAGKLDSQLEQRLLSWEGHALSWLATPMPLHLMRFEAMRHDPLPTFRAAVRFLGLDHDDRAIERALETCRIERLQRMERERPFAEAPRAGGRFFRRGETGEGLVRLGEEQLRRLEGMHRRVARAARTRQAEGR